MEDLCASLVSRVLGGRGRGRGRERERERESVITEDFKNS